jgi:cobalamin biosynthesis protein CobT
VPSAKTVIKALQKADDDDVFHDGLASMAEELEEIAKISGSITLNKHPPFYQGKGAYDVSQQVKSKAHQIGQRVRSIVQSINEVPMVAGFIGDELMVQNVARMRFGESRLFTDTAISQAPNVAFHILLDNSGSMQGRKIQVAKDATASTLLALESIPGVSVALTVFPAITDSSGASSAVVYKKHSEKARISISRFDRINSMGSTPCAEAMGVAVEDLKQRMELRKVMLIITDGAPDDVTGCMATYKLAKMLGMEVYGIGIFAEYDLPKFTDSYQVIRSLDELPKAMQDITKNNTLSNLMAA